jgi:hypothetical protein
MFPRAYSCSDTEVRCQSSQKIQPIDRRTGKCILCRAVVARRPASRCGFTSPAINVNFSARSCADRQRRRDIRLRTEERVPLRRDTLRCRLSRQIHPRPSRCSRDTAITPGTTIATEMRISLFPGVSPISNRHIYNFTTSAGFRAQRCLRNLITKL